MSQQSKQAQAEFGTDVKYIDNYIDSLSAFRDEGIMQIREDAIFSKVNDASNAAMCISRLRGSALDHISVDSDEVEIGVDFERITDMLKSIGGSSIVDITAPYAKDGKNNMHFEIAEESLTMNLPLIDTNHVPQIPQQDPIEHKTRIEVGGSELKKAFNHLDKVYDNDEGGVKIYTDDNALVFESSDKVAGSIEKKFIQSGPAEDADLGDHTVYIGWSFLKDIKGNIGKAESVIIHIKDTNPIRFDLNLDKDGDAQIIYLIAPRVDSDT